MANRESNKLSLTIFACSCAALITLLSASNCHATVANWTEPDIDTWVYVNGGIPGSRIFAPSFTGGFSLDGNNEFVERPSTEPARLASMMMAFDTSASITTGLLPERYSINSVTVTARSANGSGGTLLYENQVPTPAQYLADFISPGLDAQQPMELFGVGFREGYTGYGFGGGSDPTLFKESTAPYSASDGGYVPYPIVGDAGAVGTYHDVTNNITGGFSATSALNHTDPFYAEPWAVGEAGLSPGNAIADDTTFTFDLDLTEPGVIQYIQQSLSDGGLGFFLSSLHSTEQFGGAGAYPQWYTKEADGIFAGAEAPTLEIDYTILPYPGDFDDDDDADSADFTLWEQSFGQPAGLDGTDYLTWQRYFSEPSPALLAITIPEPSTAAIFLIGLFISIPTRRLRY